MRIRLVSPVVVLALFAVAYVGPVSDMPQSGYLDMEGTLIRHPFPDKIDSLSGQEIIELQDENGLSIWFSRYFFKDVCMTRQCRMIRLWLFWDGAGNYLGMHLFEDEPLTKSDHTKFTEADYAILDGILHDRNSILKELRPDDLEIETTKNDEDAAVDAYSSATRPTLIQVVVENAVYTCHTLWHTVYGHTSGAIHDILMQRANEEYLANIFRNGNSVYVSLGIDLVANARGFHEAFYPAILRFIPSDDQELSDKALAYFEPEFLLDQQLQRALASLVPEVDANRKNEIIWKFIVAGKTDADVVWQLLEMFRRGEIGVGSLNLVFRLIRPEHLSDRRISSILDSFASSDNAYIRSLTNNQFNNK